MEPNDDILRKVEGLLASKFRDMEMSGSATAWNQYLEVLGVSRVGKLVGLCVGTAEGSVRVSDPVVVGGNRGFIDMPEDTAIKIASMGLP